MRQFNTTVALTVTLFCNAYFLRNYATVTRLTYKAFLNPRITNGLSKAPWQSEIFRIECLTLVAENQFRFMCETTGY